MSGWFATAFLWSYARRQALQGNGRDVNAGKRPCQSTAERNCATSTEGASHRFHATFRGRCRHRQAPRLTRSDGSPKKSQRGGHKANSSPRCSAYGRGPHSRFLCPTRGAVCRKCGSRGHFAAAYWTKQARSFKVGASNDEAGTRTANCKNFVNLHIQRHTPTQLRYVSPCARVVRPTLMSRSVGRTTLPPTIRSRTVGGSRHPRWASLCYFERNQNKTCLFVKMPRLELYQ